MLRVFSRISFDNIVEVRVGSHPYMHVWHLAGRELMRYSFFFRSVFLHLEFHKSDTRFVDFPDADPEVFHIFIEWVNTKIMGHPYQLQGKGYGIRLLIRAYVLGEMLDCPRFKNAIMMVVDQAKIMTLSVTPGDVEYAFRHCNAKCKLNEMLADVLAAEIRDSRIRMSLAQGATEAGPWLGMEEPATWVQLFRRGGDLIIELLARLEGVWAPGLTPESPAELRYMEPVTTD